MVRIVKQMKKCAAEVVIVDNQSEDETAELAEKLEFKIIQNHEKFPKNLSKMVNI